MAWRAPPPLEWDESWHHPAYQQGVEAEEERRRQQEAGGWTEGAQRMTMVFPDMQGMISQYIATRNEAFRQSMRPDFLAIFRRFLVAIIDALMRDVFVMIHSRNPYSAQGTQGATRLISLDDIDDLQRSFFNLVSNHFLAAILPLNDERLQRYRELVDFMVAVGRRDMYRMIERFQEA